MLLGTGSREPLPSGLPSNMIIESLKDEMAFKKNLAIKKNLTHIKLIIFLFTGTVYSKITVWAYLSISFQSVVFSSLIPTLRGIYILNLLYANGKFKFIGSGQEMHALVCFSHREGQKVRFTVGTVLVLFFNVCKYFLNLLKYLFRKGDRQSW